MSNAYRNIFSKNKRNISLSLIIVCLLYFALILFAEPKKIFEAFSKLSLLNWLLILSCSFSNYLLRFSRWHYYIRYLNHHVPPLQSFLYYMAGFSLTLTPAKIGETIRSTYLAQHTISYTKSLSMFFSERFLDVVVIAFLSLFVLKSEYPNNDEIYQNFIIISFLLIVSFIPLLRQTFVTQFIAYIQSKVNNIRYAFIRHNQERILIKLHVTLEQYNAPRIGEILQFSSNIVWCQTYHRLKMQRVNIGKSFISWV